MTNEILKMEQLEQVAGGNDVQNKVDRIFFQKLGYDMSRTKLASVFSENGFFFSTDFDGDNKYRMEVDGKWVEYPHYAALGIILINKKYPGFYGSWNDEKNVKSFLKENFGINDLG